MGGFLSTSTSVCFCFCLWGVPRFSAIVKLDIFIFCRDSLSIVGLRKFCKVVLLTVL